jgi:deoxyribose-phosphate aldolase
MGNQTTDSTLFKHIDLTRLVLNDSEADMLAFLAQMNNDAPNVAAVCVYPKWVRFVKSRISSSIGLAAVVNFPSGDMALEDVLAEIDFALNEGATEIDCVLPYRALLAGKTDVVVHFLKTVRQQAGDTVLKMILETGAMTQPDDIKQAATLSIDAGVDFIKTSTGKIETGATLNAASIMLECIKTLNPKVGLKVSGGIKTPETAIQFYQEAVTHLGEDWVATPDHFRIGASTLYQALQRTVT